MASFAQNASIQFAPYTPQYNTQLYAQIGMNRQAAFDTNVQKIQSYVDSVAGFNVTRPVDKQYLQGKLSELQGNLNTLQNGDYSKNEVLNTAAGYVKYIANDKNLLNAAISTANIQKDYEAMAKAREEGKSSAANDSYLQDRMSAYMNSDQLGTIYQAQGYTPYYNIADAFSKYYKDKRGNIQIEETPMGLNEDGTPNWKAYTLVNGKREYLTSAEVAQDFQSFLATDQQAAQQLGIDARFYAKNTSNEASLSLLNETYNRNLQTIDKEISRNEVLFNNSTGEERTKLEAKLDSLRAARNSSVARHQEAQKLFESDPESFKRNTYMQGVSAGIGNRYAYESVETTLKKNPIAEMELERQKFQAAENERAFRRTLSKAEYDLSVQRLELSKQAANKKASIDAEGNIVYEDVQATTVEPVATSLEDIQAQQDVLQEEVFSGPGGVGEVLYFSQGNKNGAIIKTQDGRYIANPNDPNAWQDSWSDLFSKWQKDPNSTPYMEKFQRGRYVEGSAWRKREEWRLNKKIIDNELQNFNETLTPQEKAEYDRANQVKTALSQVETRIPNQGISVSGSTVFAGRQTIPKEVITAYIRTVQGDTSAGNYYELRDQDGNRYRTEKIQEYINSVAPGVLNEYNQTFVRDTGAIKKSQSLQSKENDLAARLAATNQNVSITYTTKETEGLLPSIMNLANLQQTGGKTPKALESMQDVINANGRTNVGAVIRKNPNTGKTTIHLMGFAKKGSSLSEGLELTAEQAEVFAPGIGSPVDNEVELKAIRLSDNQTTEGLLSPYVPQVNVNTRYAFQTHFGEMSGEYYPKVMYFDRQDQSKGWRQLPVTADMYFQDQSNQRGSGITKAKQFVDQFIYKLDAETFETKWLR